MNSILSSILIDLSEIIDNNEVLSIEEIKSNIDNKNIMQYLIGKYGNKYENTKLSSLVDFRIAELNNIIYNTYDAHNLNKLPNYNNGLNLLIGLIAQAID